MDEVAALCRCDGHMDITLLLILNVAAMVHQILADKINRVCIYVCLKKKNYSHSFLCVTMYRRPCGRERPWREC
jgi:hypothetical protein